MSLKLTAYQVLVLPLHRREEGGNSCEGKISVRALARC